jgi:hypothetical protein
VVPQQPPLQKLKNNVKLVKMLKRKKQKRRPSVRQQRT